VKALGEHVHILVISLVVIFFIAQMGSSLQTTYAKEPLVFRGSLKFYIDSLNPFVAQGSEAYTVLNIIYESLVVAFENGTIKPWLAERWEVSEDGKVWTFYLVKNATFHDGEPLTAEDVKFTFDLLKKHRFRPEITDPIERVEVVDNYTVRFYLSSPFAPFLIKLSSAWAGIVPKHIWEKIEDPSRYENIPPIGSGPFKFVEWKKREYVILEAYDNYWKGRPIIDKVIFKVYTNPDAEALALRKGEIDEIDNVMPQMVGSLSIDPNIKVRPYAAANARYLSLNHRVYPLNVKEFRKALSIAIDKRDILNIAVQGFGDLGAEGELMPALKYWFNPKVVWPYANMTDEERYKLASEILDELGFIDRDGDGIRETPNGTKLEFSIAVASEYPTSIRAAEIIKNDLANIGIKIEIEAYAATTLIDKVFMSIDYEMAWMGWGLEPDPDYFYTWWYSRSDPPGWLVRSTGYKNDTLDDLIELQRKIVDPEERREVVFKIQEILAEEIPVVMLWFKHMITAYRIDRFEGWDPIVGLETKPGLLMLKPKGVPTTVVTTVTSPTVITTVTTVTSPTTVVTTVSGVPTTVVTTATTVITTVTTAIAEVIPTWMYAVIIILIILIIIAVVLRRR